MHARKLSQRSLFAKDAPLDGTWQHFPDACNNKAMQFSCWMLLTGALQGLQKCARNSKPPRTPENA